jgi:hypothetical protein
VMVEPFAARGQPVMAMVEPSFSEGGARRGWLNHLKRE